MTLTDAIAAAGMTPPRNITTGRWMRFPGVGKGRSNRAGWCRVITPTLAIFGDWSTGISEVWRDNAHYDDAESRRLLAEARAREREFARQQVVRAKEVECEAQRLLSHAKQDTHPYLMSKGFRHTLGLVSEDRLLIPIRAVEDYSRLISLQTIAPDGTKRFLPGGRVKGGIHRLGHLKPAHMALCEGLATGLSVCAALKLLPGPHAVVVCFSAGNLVEVAPRFPGAIVCADNDASGTGEQAARKTGLKWAMPPEVGTDFNDLHQRAGLIHVVEVLRAAF